MRAKIKKLESQPVTVVVQEIHTLWTKASRGGHHARLRNSTPEIVDINVSQLVANGQQVMHQYVFYNERNDFQLAKELIRTNEVVQPFYGCTSLDYNFRKGIWAKYTYSRQQGGAPDRGCLLKSLFAPINQWVQICENGRFTVDWDGDWWYQKVIVNAGVFENIQPDAFKTIEPVERYKSLADLW